MSAPPSVIRVPRRAWYGLACVLLVPWVLVVWLLLRETSGPKPAAPATPAAAPRSPDARGPVADEKPAGPWGRLSFSRILIEPPEDFIPVVFTSPQPIAWHLPAADAAAAARFWQEVGLAPAVAARLQGTAPGESGGGRVIRPDPEAVLALSPADRAKLYTALAADPRNALQRDPFRCRSDAVEDWFEGSGLPDDVVALTRRLLYERNGSMYFSDHDLVLPRIPTAAGRIRYIKVMSRKTALLGHLRVDRSADVDALVRYWGQGRRSKDIEPLLQSLARRPEGGDIDLVHLLPPFARRLLYTYPIPSDDPADLAHDCHWTSLNFYSTQPDNRFADIEQARLALLRDYYRVNGAPALGDIVMLVRPDGQGVHSCVYVADDVVFTKNGAAFSVPWTLARLENVVAFYTVTEPLEVRRYRLKPR
jgi:hypothetical protein